MLSRVFFDIRYSARKFVRAPGLALTLLLTIALGIGSNVAIDGFARGLNKPEFPQRSLDGIVSIFGQDANHEAGPLSYEEYRLLKSHNDTFEWVAAARISPVSIVMADQSAIVSVAALTSNVAGALEIPLEKGVVISRRLWQDEFGGKADVRGQQIRMNGVRMSVSGIAQSWLEGLYRDRAIDVWVALSEKDPVGVEESNRNFWLLARLRRGVSVHLAQSAIRRSRTAFAKISVLPYTGMTPEMAQGMSFIATLLGFAAGSVFFTSCANVMSFLLGRAFARSHETSLRVALGAGRWQLARELLSDSIVISVAGGAGGLLLSFWTMHVVPALLFEQDTERLLFAPSMVSILAASGGCVCITILCGLIPVFFTLDHRAATVLRRESAGPSKAMRRLRVTLMVTQITSCCVLVIFTAFLVDGLRAALGTSSGHRLGDPLLISTQAQPYTEIAYFRQVKAIARSAGILRTAWVARLPGSQPVWQSFHLEPPHLPDRVIPMDIASFTTESLKHFGLPPKAGRLFGFEDQSCRAAIVNEVASAELFGRNTVGRTIQDPTGMPVEIIGVVAETVRDGRKSRPTIYYNYANQPGRAPERIAGTHFRAPIASDLAGVELNTNVVSADYFELMGLPLVAGQEFTDRPMSGECRVAVINQEASDLYFGGKAVGGAVIDDRGIRTTVIGVVHSRPLGTFQRRAEPAIYFPMWQDCPRRMTLIAVTREANNKLLADLRRGIESVPGRGSGSVVVETFATQLAQTALAPLRIATVVLSTSATTAVLLSIAGLFGALSDAARHRRRELAIRTALGAQRWRVIWQVLQEGGRLAGAGALAGMLGALALSRLLVRLTPGSRSPSLLVWLAAPLVLAIAVAIASVLPARRALIVNPVTIMRDDN